MSPIRWWDLHPLDSPHVSDFVAELSILSNDHICPCHQATAKAYFCISHAITCHMTLDASLRPSNVKCCNWAHLYHSGTLQSMNHCTYKEYCDLIWANTQGHGCSLSDYHTSCYVYRTQSRKMVSGRVLTLIHNHLLTPCLSLRGFQERRQWGIKNLPHRLLKVCLCPSHWNTAVSLSLVKFPFVEIHEYKTEWRSLWQKEMLSQTFSFWYKHKQIVEVAVWLYRNYYIYMIQLDLMILEVLSNLNNSALRFHTAWIGSDLMGSKTRI